MIIYGPGFRPLPESKASDFGAKSGDFRTMTTNIPIDLNCDLGESFGNYSLGNDAAIMPFITSANIACGFHAGDPLVMQATIRLAKQHGVAVGAHPGWPDLQGFGRREMNVSPAEAEALVLYQIGALAGFAKPRALNCGMSSPTGHSTTRPQAMPLWRKPLPGRSNASAWSWSWSGWQAAGCSMRGGQSA